MAVTAIARRRPPAPTVVPTAVRVLEADPDLADGLEEPEVTAARLFSMAPEFAFEPGPWRFDPAPEPGALGALVLDGLILVRIGIGCRIHSELLGEGDLIGPWATRGTDIVAPSTISAQVVTPARVALLDRSFAVRTGRWPEVHAALIRRLIQRSRTLSMQSAINSLARTEQRLELTMWHLASRFGRVTRDGVRLELPISQTHLAEIIAAQRPSVSAALARLEQRGRLTRVARRNWLLCGDPPPELAVLSQQTGQAA
jgi:CRP/FNR family cyclic AMP-dependent transcriptional regulator